MDKNAYDHSTSEVSFVYYFDAITTFLPPCRGRCFLFAVITVTRHLWIASAKRSRPPIVKRSTWRVVSNTWMHIGGGSLWANLGRQWDTQMMTVRLQREDIMFHRISMGQCVTSWLSVSQHPSIQDITKLLLPGLTTATGGLVPCEFSSWLWWSMAKSHENNFFSPHLSASQLLVEMSNAFSSFIK